MCYHNNIPMMTSDSLAHSLAHSSLCHFDVVASANERLCFVRFCMYLSLSLFPPPFISFTPSIWVMLLPCPVLWPYLHVGSIFLPFFYPYAACFWQLVLTHHHSGCFSVCVLCALWFLVILNSNHSLLHFLPCRTHSNLTITCNDFERKCALLCV